MKSCHNCKHVAVWIGEEPCRTCLKAGMRNINSRWEPKQEQPDPPKRCIQCAAFVSDATGHTFESGAALCGPCAREFYRWYKGRMGRQNHCRDDQTECFNEAAEKSIKG